MTLKAITSNYLGIFYREGALEHYYISVIGGQQEFFGDVLSEKTGRSHCQHNLFRLFITLEKTLKQQLARIKLAVQLRHHNKSIENEVVNYVLC